MRFKKGDKFKVINKFNELVFYEINILIENDCYIYSFSYDNKIFHNTKADYQLFENAINNVKEFHWITESEVSSVNKVNKYDQDIRNFFKSGSHNQAKVWAIKRER